MNSILFECGQSLGFGDHCSRFADSSAFELTLVLWVSDSLCETGNGFRGVGSLTFALGIVLDGSDQSISRLHTNSKQAAPMDWLWLSRHLFGSECIFITLCDNKTAISAQSYALKASPVLESMMLVPDSDVINESVLLGDFAASEVVYQSADVALSELLVSELLGISTILKQSILQSITSILKITLPITDSTYVADESVSKLKISARVESDMSWFVGALSTENGKEGPNDRSLAVALGVFFVLFIMSGFFLCRIIRQHSDKYSYEEESGFEIEPSSNMGGCWAGDDLLA
jgi:hypothetical protein